jgi:hypothetical protein
VQGHKRNTLAHLCLGTFLVKFQSTCNEKLRQQLTLRVLLLVADQCCSVVNVGSA